jgi:hypothetical protein
MRVFSKRNFEKPKQQKMCIWPYLTIIGIGVIILICLTS